MVRGKTASLSDLLFSKKIDILAITETCLRSHDNPACIADISPSDYSFHHRPCSIGRGVDVGFLLSDHFKVNSYLIPDYSTFESTCVDISDSSFSAYLVCLYQPLGQPANFFEEFQELFENLATLHSEFYIFGDCNLQLDKHTAVTIIFDDIIASFDLNQHLTFSTHIHGHWLDLMITHSTCDNIQMLTVSDAYQTTTQSLLMLFFPEHLYNQNIPCLTNLYIRLTLMPSRLIFLNPILSDIQRDICQTCVNNTTKYSRLYLINTPNNHQICVTKTTGSMDDS